MDIHAGREIVTLAEVWTVMLVEEWTVMLAKQWTVMLAEEWTVMLTLYPQEAGVDDIINV